MRKIVLTNAVWQFDESSQIGPKGGFGVVYRGVSNAGQNVAVKKLHLNAADFAHRELDIAKYFINKKNKHIIPFFDAGRDAKSDEYFVVMSLAEKSLQEAIDATGKLSEIESTETGLQIVEGLLEAADLVHRDLKPGNVLFHEGAWKIADFGIAKFVEDTTSEATLRKFLSKQYAAPEQWKGERPSHKTDVYALGCIFYKMLTGQPPFSGPNEEDYQEQHLEKAPQPIANISPKLASLVSLCLLKSEESRPELSRVKRLLEHDAAQAGERIGEGSKLAVVARALAEKHAEQEAGLRRAESESRRRKELAETGLDTFNQMFEELFQRLADEAPMVEKSFHKQSTVKQIRLGSALMEISLFHNGEPISRDYFQTSRWDVILGATINLTQNEQVKYIWGANLWYTNLGEPAEDFRWWEIPYMTHPLMQSHPTFQPYAVTEFSKADSAAGPGIAEIQFAAKPKKIDAEDFDSFYQRWRDLLARAVEGSLTHPRQLPLD